MGPIIRDWEPWRMLMKIFIFPYILLLCCSTDLWVWALWRVLIDPLCRLWTSWRLLESCLTRLTGTLQRSSTAHWYQDDIVACDRHTCWDLWYERACWVKNVYELHMCCSNHQGHWCMAWLLRFCCIALCCLETKRWIFLIASEGM